MQLTRVAAVWEAFGRDFCGGGASDNGGRERACRGGFYDGVVAGKEFLEVAGRVRAELHERE